VKQKSHHFGEEKKLVFSECYIHWPRDLYEYFGKKRHLPDKKWYLIFLTTYPFDR